MTKRLLSASLLFGCAPHPPQAVELAFEVTPPVGNHAFSDEPTVPERRQPPDVKLRLGHYVSRTRGIGLTIDRTVTRVYPGVIPAARLRYDGTDRVFSLDGQPGTRGRIDYYERTKLVLQIHDDGRARIWVYGADGMAEGPIELERDGDADPL
jgi:hypothetical protein